MFTKEKEIARGKYRVTEKVIDWGAIVTVASIAFVVFVILTS